MNVTYRALDYVDYDTLGCGGGKSLACNLDLGSFASRTGPADSSQSSTKSPDSLVDITAAVIVSIESPTLLSTALESMPCHLASSLLRAAIVANDYTGQFCNLNFYI